ncbi:MAG: radical SAM protein [Verrucomicrobiota bacterium]|nr:radical SAM protein [Verrucomicrobiota bacterium]
MKNWRYLFGPAPSRRLGRSMGVDLVPLKTCTLNCVFCQLGRASRRTLERRDYVPLPDVLAELAEWLRTDGRADYITLAGSGEPTLHARFGEVLDFARANSAIPTALLTNGTLLHLPEVREAARKALLVKVSLSAWDAASFEQVNRPASGLSFERLIKGCLAFRPAFGGLLWLEVFLVPGLNAAPDDVRRIAALAAEIKPDRIHLNTAVRPPAEDFAVPVPEGRMRQLAGLFTPRAEIIAEFKSEHAGRNRITEDALLAVLRRHPGTAPQIAAVFGMRVDKAVRHLGALLRTGKVRAERRDEETYYLDLASEDVISS